MPAARSTSLSSIRASGTWTDIGARSEPVPRPVDGAIVRQRTDGGIRSSDGGGWINHAGTSTGVTPRMNKSPGLLLAAMAAAFAAGGCSKSPDAIATTPAAQAVVTHVSDIDITEHVKTALHQKGLDTGFEVKVVTLNGEVRLTGMVDSQAQVDEAVRIARAAEGAHTVRNELTIKQ